MKLIVRLPSARVTSIDPGRNGLLFERFVSQGRREPPHIDVDFEHERREEVIQWVYNTYGRQRAALCSTVIRYRARGALRDGGKALGLPEDMIGDLSSQVWGCSEEGVEAKVPLILIKRFTGYKFHFRHSTTRAIAQP